MEVSSNTNFNFNKLNESLLTGLITSGFENLESLNDKIYNSIYNQDKLFYKFDSINKSSLLSVVVSTIQFLIDNPSHNVLVVSKKNDELYNTFENVSKFVDTVNVSKNINNNIVFVDSNNFDNLENIEINYIIVIDGLTNEFVNSFKSKQCNFCILLN